MIRPLPHFNLPDVFSGIDDRPSAFPMLDRAFNAVERALARLGVEDPASLRSPRPVDDVLSETALPEGTLLILSPTELRAAEADIEETVKDERLGGSVFLSLPRPEEFEDRARGLRELATAAATFGLNPSLRPAPASRLGRLEQVPLPLHLRSYRFMLADCPGFRVAVVARALPGGGFVALWTGNERAVDEMRDVLARVAEAGGHEVPPRAAAVPDLEGLESQQDVWDQAAELRAYRSVREAELREIARQAALRGVALRREREAARRKAARQEATANRRA
jgi:hypothetical protein